jgi:hypothetical protein
VLGAAIAIACLGGAASCTSLLGISDPIDDDVIDSGVIDDGVIDGGGGDGSAKDSHTTDAPPVDAGETNDSVATTPPDVPPPDTTPDTVTDTPVETGGVCSTAPDGTKCDTAYCAPKVCSGHACVAGMSPCSPPSMSCKSVTCNESSRSCSETLIDADGDGHGPASSPVASPCDDCDDGNPHAYPGEPTYYTTPRASGSYDYDCDGVETQQTTAVADCAYDSVTGTCDVTIGWALDVPACGAPGDWMSSCLYKSTSSSCSPTIITKTMACK